MLKPAYQISYQIYFKNGVFNPNIVIDDHGYDGNHINGIIDLTDKWIGDRQSFL